MFRYIILEKFEPESDPNSFGTNMNRSFIDWIYGCRVSKPIPTSVVYSLLSHTWYPIGIGGFFTTNIRYIFII